MSTAVLSPPPVSATALVQSLSPEMKDEVFRLLLREVVENHYGVYDVRYMDEEDNLIGSVVIPPGIPDERAVERAAEMPPEVRAAFSRPFDHVDLDDSIPAEEFLEQFRRQDAARTQG